jgi:hypothetical protein
LPEQPVGQQQGADDQLQPSQPERRAPRQARPSSPRGCFGRLNVQRVNVSNWPLSITRGSNTVTNSQSEQRAERHLPLRVRNSVGWAAGWPVIKPGSKPLEEAQRQQAPQDGGRHHRHEHSLLPARDANARLMPDDGLASAVPIWWHRKASSEPFDCWLTGNRGEAWHLFQPVVEFPR